MSSSSHFNYPYYSPLLLYFNALLRYVSSGCLSTMLMHSALHYSVPSSRHSYNPSMLCSAMCHLVPISTILMRSALHYSVLSKSHSHCPYVHLSQSMWMQENETHPFSHNDSRIFMHASASNLDSNHIHEFNYRYRSGGQECRHFEVIRLDKIR